MEKYTRDIQELTVLNQELASLSSLLGKQKDLMERKPLKVFVLDLQDYVAALSTVADLKHSVPIEQEDPKLINGLLTRQNELMKVLQRDFQRILTAQGDDATVLTLDAGTLRRKVAALDDLITLNQFLLQDNLSFQSFLDSGDLAAGVKPQRSFWQRLFQRK